MSTSTTAISPTCVNCGIDTSNTTDEIVRGIPINLCDECQPAVASMSKTARARYVKMLVDDEIQWRRWNRAADRIAANLKGLR